MTDSPEAQKGHSLPLEFPGPAPTPLTDAQVEAERKLCELVPLNRERQEALFEKVKDICTTLEHLNIQAEQKGFQAIADLFCKLETSDGPSLAARLRGILATAEEAENGKATLNTLWKLELELVDAYDHLADFRPQVSAASDEEYQVKFERLQTLLKGLIHELCMLPSPKHVSRICLIFKPDVASTTRGRDDDTEFDLTYELPSTVITDKEGDREHERLELVHWRGAGLSLASTSEDMSVELRKLLRSVPWTARFSQTRKDATVVRFTAMSTALSGDDFRSDKSLPRREREKVSSYTLETRLEPYDDADQHLIQSKLSIYTPEQRKGVKARLDAAIRAIEASPWVADESLSNFSLERREFLEPRPGSSTCTTSTRPIKL